MPDAFADLLATITTLRAPGGCPWDRKQTLQDAARYLLDEAAELVEAALADDPRGVREELGDLLFMTCFCCEILSEREDVDMHAVAAAGNAKLIRRHPHVFGDAQASDTTESQQQWNAIKAQEKRERGEDPDTASVLKELPAATAPLHQAYRFQKDAAEVGFDWPDLAGVRAKLDEELAEMDEALASDDRAAIEHEIGDVLFAVVNIARRLHIQPDMAMRRVNNRFRDRFHLVEQEFSAPQRPLAQASLEEMEAAWRRAKLALADRED
ncbi:nucleoside triphosphate pyrophosphohydrolase [bacterium]|nr:nucleoside triphosphate pyrophosphohydrolase [bacterium]PJA76265.1 MAG: nucleoside triphosphate pyrophosphohydrolase [bacterium CG_4_9_14_3_um_filter_65_15]